jgi:hypothetical protein
VSRTTDYTRTGWKQRSHRAFLFGFKPWDPEAFGSAPTFLNVIELLAVWLPAARESHVDPMQALRSEYSGTSWE